jgi:uncharacterized protein YbjT (DUF2867 family)
MILITGASGKTGKAIIAALAAKREQVRAFVHHPDQARAVVEQGAVQAVVGDLHDESALRGAMEGVRAVYHICPNVSPDEVAIGQAAIAAALSVKLEHFVYHSVLHPQAEAMSHHWNKLRVEELLFQSGLPFTIVQPTAYMQNILAGWHFIVGQGIYAVPYPAETRLSLVDLEDVAAAVANILTEVGHTRAIYELVGTPGLQQSDVAETLSTSLNRPVRVEVLNHDTWRDQALAAGQGQYQVETLLKMFRYYEQYGMYGNPNVLAWLLRRAPQTLMGFMDRTIRERGLTPAQGGA